MNITKIRKIEEFYATNYSKCNLTYSFLASWQGLAYPTHSIQILAFPIQIFTFYIIMRHTPMAMKMMKVPILVNHFCCTLLDLIVCTMSTPYFFFENTGFFGVGLFTYFGMSQMPQLLFGIPCAILMANSYIYMFETRSNILPLNRFRIRGTWKRTTYHSYLFLVNCTLLTILIRTPEDQEAAKLESLALEPCPTREFFTSDVLIVMPDIQAINFTLFIHSPFLLLHIAIHGLFHVFATVNILFMTSFPFLSPESRRNQQQFFMAIVFQTIVPLSLLLIVMVVVIVAGVQGGLKQEHMNLVVIIFSWHGLVESVTVLVVHGSYRNAAIRIVRGRVVKRVLVGDGQWTTSIH